MAVVKPECSGPFSDARDCPVHGPQMPRRATVSDRARLDALIEAVRRFQTETHREDCRCALCQTLQRAITDALTPEAA